MFGTEVKDHVALYVVYIRSERFQSASSLYSKLVDNDVYQSLHFVDKNGSFLNLCH